MQDTPKGLRRHIAIIGRRNAGKSSLANALARQQVSIVSSEPGTTTDPVEKTLEIKPLGPVVLLDTAGTDDEGALGAQRVQRTLNVLARADLAVIVTDADNWAEPEIRLLQELEKNKIPFVIARNKMENGLSPLEQWRTNNNLQHNTVIDLSAKTALNLDSLVLAMATLAGDENAPPLLADLLPPAGLALLVVPIDSGAPKGRLILPQVQAIRDLLDHDKMTLVCTEKNLSAAIARFQPDLVVCDSQVAKATCEATPEHIPFTTFSILMAKAKGNLAAFAHGAKALTTLRPGDAVLIQEACSHHAQKDDIGRGKIPALLRRMAGGDLQINFDQGKELVPYDPSLKVIIHCGACVITSKQMRLRQRMAADCAIPMTNYGVAICHAQGLLPRALRLFPEALQAFQGEA